MADTISKEHRSWNMSRIKGKNTNPEILVRSLLHRAGFRFRVHDKNLPGRPDIVLRKYGAVVLVHGCFWHRHENCPNATTPKTRPEFWEEKFRQTVARDQRQESALNELGWRVFCIWECELKRDAVQAVGAVAAKLKGETNGN